MFSESLENQCNYIRKDKHSQNANSSIEDDYVKEELEYWNPQFKYNYSREEEIDEEIFLDENVLKKYKAFARLITIVEKGFKKLNHNIEMLISAQKVHSGVVDTQNFNDPLDLEREFNDRPHPFKIFEESELPKLTNLERKRYNEWLMEAKNDTPLAFYLFKNNDLSRSSKIAAKSCFLKFI